LVIGALAAVACYYGVQVVKHRLAIDDSLDVFAVHGIGGMLGTLLIPVLATFGPGAPGLPEGMSFATQLGAQAAGIVAVAGWSALGSFGILFVLKQAITLRVEPETET